MPEKNEQRLERTGDPETDEILGEIDREGAPIDQEDDEDKAPESSVEGDQLGDEGEAGPEAGAGGEPEIDEDDEDLESSRSDRRTSKDPLSTREYGRERHWEKKAHELQAKIEELSKKQSAVEIQGKLKELAEKEGIPLERLSMIAEVISESVTSKLMSPEQRTKIDRAVEYATREAESERQDSMFDAEFRETVLPLISEDQDANEVYQALHAEAFASKPENDYDPRTGRPSRSLVQIFVAGVPRQGRRSGESSRIRSGGRSGDKPISQMTADEIAEMPDDQFDKLSDEAALMSPSLVRPNKRAL